MAFFDRFRKREEEPHIEPPISDALLSALIKNEVITRDKALMLPAVSGAVDLISNCVACMPVKLYKIKKGTVEEVTDDTRTALLNGDTGDTLDAFQMKKAMVMDYLLGKGGYTYIQRNRNEVTGLFYVEDIHITVLKNFKPIFKDYQILVEGNAYKPYDFIKLLRNTKDGSTGVGLTAEVSKALETAYQTLLYQLGMVKNGGNKRGFLKSQRVLGQEEINTLKSAWRRYYANDEENVVVLNNGLEFQEASNNSVEMQLNESKRTLQEEINKLFHISDDFDLTFKEGIYPIIKAYEIALNRDLLLEKEKGKYFFEFDVKEIIKASLTDRYNAYKTAKETGFMTLNEIRRAENMNYIEGLDVVNVGLGAVLYDVDTHQFFVPNTGDVQEMGEEGAENIDENVDENVEQNLDSDDLESQSLDDGSDDTEIDDLLNDLEHEMLGEEARGLDDVDDTEIEDALDLLEREFLEE
ncbi:MAG: phage portal protein [Paludibacteraceae bacterium]|nr:phage portal protein [Paludibacteraceae bacterium]